jgi:hypothetical protein
MGLNQLFYGLVFLHHGLDCSVWSDIHQSFKIDSDTAGAIFYNRWNWEFK